MATGGVFFSAPLPACSGLAEEIGSSRAAGRPRPGGERRPAGQRLYSSSGIRKAKQLLSDRPQPGEGQEKEETIQVASNVHLSFAIFTTSPRSRKEGPRADSPLKWGRSKWRNRGRETM